MRDPNLVLLGQAARAGRDRVEIARLGLGRRADRRVHGDRGERVGDLKTNARGLGRDEGALRGALDRPDVLERGGALAHLGERAGEEQRRDAVARLARSDGATQRRHARSARDARGLGRSAAATAGATVRLTGD